MDEGNKEISILTKFYAAAKSSLLALNEYVPFSVRTSPAAPWRHDEFPRNLVVQLCMVFGRAIPSDMMITVANEKVSIWSVLEHYLAEAHAYPFLPLIPGGPGGRMMFYFGQLRDVQASLGLVEVLCRVIDFDVRQRYPAGELRPYDPDEALATINQRFRENGVGYQYVRGCIVRMDSQYIHESVVAPAMGLLRDSKFMGAEDEFREAQRAYRRGDNEIAIVEACKALESTIKVICENRDVRIQPERASAGALIELVLKNKLVPTYLDDGLKGLAALLKSIVPVIRNREAAHGQGKEVREVPRQLVAYALHVTAATIVMLVEAHRANR